MKNEADSIKSLNFKRWESKQQTYQLL